MKTMEMLQDIFRDVFDDEGLTIGEETTAADIEDWDSLSHMQLIAEIEKRFGVRFTTDEIRSAKNVGEFAALIERKKG